MNVAERNYLIFSCKAQDVNNNFVIFCICDDNFVIPKRSYDFFEFIIT